MVRMSPAWDDGEVVKFVRTRGIKLGDLTGIIIVITAKDKQSENTLLKFYTFHIYFIFHFFRVFVGIENKVKSYIYI